MKVPFLDADPVLPQVRGREKVHIACCGACGSGPVVLLHRAHDRGGTIGSAEIAIGQPCDPHILRVTEAYVYYVLDDALALLPPFLISRSTIAPARSGASHQRTFASGWCGAPEGVRPYRLDQLLT